MKLIAKTETKTSKVRLFCSRDQLYILQEKAKGEGRNPWVLLNAFAKKKKGVQRFNSRIRHLMHSEGRGK